MEALHLRKGARLAGPVLRRLVATNPAAAQQAQQGRQFFAAAYNLAKKVTPKISATEAAALDAGTVGFDRDIFAGNPSLAQLKQKYDLKVSGRLARACVRRLCSASCIDRAGVWWGWGLGAEVARWRAAWCLLIGM